MADDRSISPPYRCTTSGAGSSGPWPRGVATDSRGDILRLGPAPYLSDRQLEDAVAALCEVVTELGKSDRRSR